MKEMEKHDRDSERLQIESVQARQENQEFKLIGSLRPLKGHTLWEINRKTLEIKPAKYTTSVKKKITWHEALKIHNGHQVKTEVIVDKDCEYISALTKESALQRYLSGKGSAKMNDKKKIL